MTSGEAPDRNLSPGLVTVTFVAGSWADRAGRSGLGGQEAFTIDIPSFQLANPPPGG